MQQANTDPLTCIHVLCKVINKLHIHTQNLSSELSSVMHMLTIADIKNWMHYMAQNKVPS